MAREQSKYILNVLKGLILLKNSDFQQNLKTFTHTTHMKIFCEGFSKNGLPALMPLLGAFRDNPHKISAKMRFWRKFSISQFGSFSTK